MGFESFRVELRGGRTTYSEANETIRKQPHVRLDEQSPATKGSTYYVMDDGRQVIEVEVKDAPVRISCRFTLCHPPSIDSVFLERVRELLLQFGMEVSICDEVRPEDAHPFSLAHYTEFSSAALRSIAARRTEWIAAFGTEQMTATTNQVYKRIILPRCQPVAGWTEKNQERDESRPLS
jgi:hypothetical protein